MNFKFKRVVPQHVICPIFYLPVYFLDYNRKKVCYPFFIAPFVLLFLITKNSLLSIWKDLISFNSLLFQNTKQKDDGGSK